MERGRGGSGEEGGGGGGELYLTLHCQHQNDFLHSDRQRRGPFLFH